MHFIIFFSWLNLFLLTKPFSFLLNLYLSTNFFFYWQNLYLLLAKLLPLDKTSLFMCTTAILGKPKPWMFTFWTTYKHNKFVMEKIKKIDWTNKKVEIKWNQIQIQAKHFKKEQHLLVKLTSNKLLHITNIPLWKVEFIPCTMHHLTNWKGWWSCWNNLGE